jgi:hypothetical protein
MWGKVTFPHWRWECKISATVMENNVEVPQKLKIELPYNSMIPLLGIYPKNALQDKIEPLAYPYLLLHYLQ